MKLVIKNMVCPRCIMVVRDLLTSMGYSVSDVQLGYALLDCDSLPQHEIDNIGTRLKALDFELLTDSDVEMVERIKLAVIKMARTEGGLKIKLSRALEQALGHNYKFLTTTFSLIEGRTIENYYISQRIEYVKELVSYGQLSIDEIAYLTGYSSVAYLSKQFSQVVGMTMTEYRNCATTLREPLTNV